MKYLTICVETYRVDTETEAATLINSAKTATEFALIKYNCEHKERKQKGEIIDEYYKVTLTKGFNDEKDPDRDIIIAYEVD